MRWNLFLILLFILILILTCKLTTEDLKKPTPHQPTNFFARTVSLSEINLTWLDNSLTEHGFIIEQGLNNSDFERIDTVSEKERDSNFEKMNLGISSIEYIEGSQTKIAGPSVNFRIENKKINESGFFSDFDMGFGFSSLKITEGLESLENKILGFSFDIERSFGYSFQIEGNEKNNYQNRKTNPTYFIQPSIGVGFWYFSESINEEVSLSRRSNIVYLPLNIEFGKLKTKKDNNGQVSQSYSFFKAQFAPILTGWYRIKTSEHDSFVDAPLSKMNGATGLSFSEGWIHSINNGIGMGFGMTGDSVNESLLNDSSDALENGTFTIPTMERLNPGIEFIVLL